MASVLKGNNSIITGNTTFTVRPMFGSNVPWDAGNLTPSNYASLSGATFTGPVSIPTLTVTSRPTFANNTPWDSGNFDPTQYALNSGASFSGAIASPNHVVTGISGQLAFQDRANTSANNMLMYYSGGSTFIYVNGANRFNFDSGGGLSLTKVTTANLAITGVNTVLTIGANSATTGIEFGNINGVATSPYIDFHTTGLNTDYDARIIASSSANTSLGQGVLTYQASTHAFTGAMSVSTSMSSPVIIATGTGNYISMQDRANTAANTFTLYYTNGIGRFFLNNADRATIDTSGNFFASGTITGNAIQATSSGDATLNIQTTGAGAANTFSQKIIYSTVNDGWGGSGWLFRSRRPSDGGYYDYALEPLPNGTIAKLWTTYNFNPSNYAQLNSSPTFTGTVTSNYMVSNLGLSIKTSNTTINGGYVILDMSAQGTFRLYEAGSPYRGVSLDFGSCGAQSTLWHSGNLSPAGLNFNNVFSGQNYIPLGAQTPTSGDITQRVEGGFYNSSTTSKALGWPTDSGSWQHLIASTHTNVANYYSMQMAGEFYDNDRFYVRKTMGVGNTAWRQLWHDGNQPIIPLAQCRLVASSDGSQLVLQPCNGNRILINGAYRTIPAAGVNITPAGLSRPADDPRFLGPYYYIYAYMNGSTMALEASTIKATIDPVSGMMVKGGTQIEMTQSLPPMTSNVLPSGHVASSSGDISTSNQAWCAMSQGAQTQCWHAPTGTTAPWWIQRQVPTPFILGKYSITSRLDYAIPYSPLSWQMKGSNDGTNWVNIDVGVGQGPWGPYETRYFDCSFNNTAYSYYRLNVTAGDQNVGYINMGELQLFAKVSPAQDVTRVLVGMAAIAGAPGSTYFSDQPSLRYVASYYNRRRKFLTTPNSFAGASTGSNLYTELQTISRIRFLTWNDDVTSLMSYGYFSCGGTGVGGFLSLGFDTNAGKMYVATNPGVAHPATMYFSQNLSEGWHWGSVYAYVSPTGSGYATSFNGGFNGEVVC